jgi:hypothetical protein
MNKKVDNHYRQLFQSSDVDSEVDGTSWLFSASSGNTSSPLTTKRRFVEFASWPSRNQLSISFGALGVFDRYLIQSGPSGRFPF